MTAPDFTFPRHLPRMTAWVCTYDGPDGRYGIILHGSDPEQIVRDNGEALPGLTVDGRHEGTVRGGEHDRS